MAHMKSSLMRILNTIRLFLIFAISIPDAFASGPADTVFINGNIVTVDAEFSIVEAIAITDCWFAKFLLPLPATMRRHKFRLWIFSTLFPCQ